MLSWSSNCGESRDSADAADACAARSHGAGSVCSSNNSWHEWCASVDRSFRSETSHHRSRWRRLLVSDPGQADVDCRCSPVRKSHRPPKDPSALGPQDGFVQAPFGALSLKWHHGGDLGLHGKGQSVLVGERLCLTAWLLLDLAFKSVVAAAGR